MPRRVDTPAGVQVLAGQRLGEPGRGVAGAVTGKDIPSRPTLPSPEDVAEVLGFVPLLEVYFRRCLQVEMPAPLQEIFRHHRLTARHGGVLAQLSAGQPISVTELARRMGVSLSTANELVATWVGRGWSSGARTRPTGAAPWPAWPSLTGPPSKPSSPSARIPC
jgi:MarR family